MKQKFWLLALFLSVLGLSCKKDLPYNPAAPDNATAADASQKATAHLKIAVVSDLHYTSPSLFTNNGAAGLAFQAYLEQDPKLIEFSDPILRTVMADLKAEKPDILLVPGDLTKDGERVGHEAVAAFLTELKNEGTKVYVLPGNHDINNAKAKRFDGNNAYPVATILPSDFVSIYGAFGYNNAAERDPNSLSYLVKPEKDLWIIAIDASRYAEYGPDGDIADGRIKPATLNWVLAKLAEANSENVTVIGMMHHNLVEHYAGQTQLDAGYVIEDWQNVAGQLADAGLRYLFTGHYHANDITSFVHNGSEIFDIETGALTTPPSPYRIVWMRNKKLEISTRHVTSIQAALPGGVSFVDYSTQFMNQHLDGYFHYLLANKFGVPEPLATFASPVFRTAIMAHFAGDENMPPDQAQLINQIGLYSPQLAGMATTLWTDLGVADNNVLLRSNK